jgi:rhodanese-related sulfurtransferase
VSVNQPPLASDSKNGDSTVQTTTRSAARMVGEAKQRVQSLSPAQAAAEIRRRKVVLVDVRESTERAQIGSIRGSIHAPRGMLELHADPCSPYRRSELDPSRRVILYCASGERSALAADLLASMGYTNVAHLDGGLRAWEAAGYVVPEGGS